MVQEKIGNIREIVEEIMTLLECKNREYGDSYSKKDGVRITDLSGEQRISARIQEKLDRWSTAVKNGQRVSEDTIVDLVGLLLFLLEERRHG